MDTSLREQIAEASKMFGSSKGRELTNELAIGVLVSIAEAHAQAVAEEARAQGAKEMCAQIKAFMAAGAVPTQQQLDEELEELLTWQKGKETPS